jgi:hypothetical protein
MNYRVDGRGSIPGGNKIAFSPPEHPHQLWVQPASYPMCTGKFSTGVKQHNGEANHSPPFIAEVKNAEAITLLPHMSSWHGVYLIKHWHNFTFTFTISSTPMSPKLRLPLKFTD